ncbi:alpha/beta hydrolase-fold protein [Pontimicrobium aquaticum]|uniref:Uncharacterized protein n=1 Tax=Pontimicrobium aquaticum TaxID=2565367 RepID=A0A4U0EVT4_9FLAO|nr:alpha/beta hydrolase-fold protein [Pontimicrobium aquaticum]TJY35973.1 hypothetical protein E5167_08910 [Pontimicrobium aquaticum]
MKYFMLLALVISNQFYAQNKIEHFDVDSKYLQETRTVSIALPKNYEQSAKRYPLILTLDQGLLFHTTTAIANHLSSSSRMPESIVVTLSAGSKHRNYYAPNLYNNHRDRLYNYGDHQEELLNFIEYELLPLIEEQFRVAKFRMLVGFSPSSVFSLYTALVKPNLFQAYICLAAGNIIGDGYAKDERLIEALEKLYNVQQPTQQYLYIVSGSKDAEGQPYIHTNIKDFNAKLSKHHSSGMYAKAELIEGEGHTDVVLPGLISAFNFIFPKEKWIVDYLNLIEENGTAKENIVKFYNNLSKVYGFQVYPNADRLYSMSCLKNIGRRLLGTNKTSEAIELYEYWTTLYPQSHLAYYYLGMSYEKHNDLDNAIKAYNKSYALAMSQNSSEAEQYKNALKNLKQ